MIIDIVTDEKLLRTKSREATRDQVVVMQVFENLEDTLRATGGLGLSAIQIGLPFRVCIVQAKLNKAVRMMNPVIEIQIDPIKVQGEGCLSFPGLYIDTWRYQQSVIRWYDIDGTMHRAVFTGLEAVVAQHEIDHMNGVFFTDRSLE